MFDKLLAEYKNEIATKVCFCFISYALIYLTYLGKKSNRNYIRGW